MFYFPLLVLTALLYAVGITSSKAETVEKFYISLDTNPTHFRNQIVDKFVEELSSTTGEALEIRVFHSGQLYKGRDELKALAWGSIQMAVPAVLSMSRFETNLNVLSLPAFYGLPYDVMRQLANGPTIDQLNDRMEQRLPVRIIGPYLELGYLDTFTVTAPITSVSAYRGLKIRVPGGAADIERYKLLGANPVAIPFADVPMAISQGAVDGISSTYETVRSGILWDTGLIYAFEDRGAYLQYIPLVSNRFWDTASPQIQQAILNAWSKVSVNGQVFAEEQQQLAKAEFIKNGGQVIVPEQSELDTKRQELLGSTPRIVRQFDLDVELVNLALQEVENYLEIHDSQKETASK